MSVGVVPARHLLEGGHDVIPSLHREGQGVTWTQSVSSLSVSGSAHLQP